MKLKRRNFNQDELEMINKKVWEIYPMLDGLTYYQIIELLRYLVLILENTTKNKPLTLLSEK